MDLRAVNRQWDQICSGMGRLRPWFELVRLPHAITAAADPLAGALLVGVSLGRLPFALSLMLAVLLLYAGAAALNDWHDLKTDRVEHPDRPLAAGRIGKWHGLLGAVILLSVGWALTSVPGARSGQMGLVLLSAVLLQEFIMKGAPAGKAVPAIARALALLLGMMLVPVTAASGMDWAMRSFFMCILGLHVLGAIILAQRPADALQRAFAIAGAATTGLAVCALGMTRVLFPARGLHPSAAVWIGLVLVVVGYPIARAVIRPATLQLRAAAWSATLGAVLVEATAVAFVRGLPLSLLVAVFILPAFWASRWLQMPPVVFDQSLPEGQNEPSAESEAGLGQPVASQPGGGDAGAE